MERMEEERRPPAAVSAMAMVSERDFRRSVTSVRRARRLGGGKASAEVVICAVCVCVEVVMVALDWVWCCLRLGWLLRALIVYALVVYALWRLR